MVLSLGLVPVYVDICRRSRRHSNDGVDKGHPAVFLRASTKRPVYGLKRVSKRAQYRLLTCVASGKIWNKSKEKSCNFKTTAAFVKHTYNSAKDNYFNSENLVSGNPGIEGQVRLDGKVSQKPETQYIAIAATPRASWDSVNSTTAFATSRFALLLGVVMTIFGAVSLIAVLFGRWWNRLREDKGSKDSWSGVASAFEAPSAFSFFLKKDIRRKESVEWVNMVLGKLWKVYRRGLETWFVDLLQPLIDNLNKPSYVRRVQIKQFYLGDEPLSVRSVERRTSRRANDLQYHIGLRYTGKAKVLLSVTLVVGFVPVIIPVGVRGMDLDGEIWVKLRLIPSEPWVGTVTWAFVSLPKIILALAPFGLFNIMAIPFISRFLTKLLTEDLPRLFVRPNKIVINFLNNPSMGPFAKQFREEGLNMDNLDNNQDFAGELSVTLVDARKLSYFPVGKTDPYVVLTLGDQVVRSKKNSQTSIIGPPGAPIWNQDFQLLVVDPKTQKLNVRVRDTFGLGVFTVGYGEIDLSTLQDTVPTDKIVPLSGGWRPLPRRFAGELMLRLTYKAYVEDEEEEDESVPLTDADSDSEKEEFPRQNYYRRKRTNSFVRDLFTTVVREMGYEATLVKPQPDDGHNGHDVQSSVGDTVQEKQFEVQPPGNPSKETSDKPTSTTVEVQSAGKPSKEISDKPTSTAVEVQSAETSDNTSKAPPLAGTKDKRNKWRLENSAIIWLSLATGIAILAALSLNFSNLLSP